MFKKINNIMFSMLFLIILFIPFLFTKWESGGISEKENRNLAQFPTLMVEGKFNLSFTNDFETWFMDHMGFRQNLINANTHLQKTVFHRSISNSDYKTGKTGDIIYATDDIIKDYAHVNLRTTNKVEEIGKSYQSISDWFADRNIPFYYVQCVDKHTIYPERFIGSVKQIGSVSKTDQVIDYLKTHTTVNTIYFKSVLEENRMQYNVFSHWGDSTHWTPRGAYISYCYMMDQINQTLEEKLKVLEEADYNIEEKSNQGPDGEIEYIEQFHILQPCAQKTDVSDMGKWSEDHRHSIWKNPEIGNNKRLLIMGDSYFNSFIVDDIAESFSEVWMVWGNYTQDLFEITDLCKPDIVIYECAERADRSASVCNLAKTLKN